MRRPDLKEVTELEASIFSDAWPISVFQEFTAGGIGYGLVTRKGEELIGYACYLLEHSHLHLTNLAVTPPQRRKSVAKQMLDRILDVALSQKCREIKLEVRASNEAARQLYEREGFIVASRILHYYDSPDEDALVMVRRL